MGGGGRGWRITILHINLKTVNISHNTSHKSEQTVNNEYTKIVHL